MRILFLAVLALAACNRSAPSSDSPSGPIVTGQEPLREHSAQPIDTNKAGDLPEPGPEPRFVGRWAEDEGSCQTAAWQFTETTLKTPAGSSCSLIRATEVPGGYDVQATCTAGGSPEPDTIKLRFAESAKALLLESKSLGDKGLVFCGRDV